MSANLMRNLLLAMKYPEGELLIEQLFSTEQKDTESMSDFASRLEMILYKLCTMAKSKFEEGYSEHLKINFIRGLRDYRVKETLWHTCINEKLTFTQVIKQARTIDCYLSISQRIWSCFQTVILFRLGVLSPPQCFNKETWTFFNEPLFCVCDSLLRW